MAKRESFLIRIDPRVLNALRGWSDDEMRSVNAQIEYLLRQSLRKAGRLPTTDASEADRESGDSNHREDSE